MKRIIKGSLLLLWMCTIFIFSHQNGAESTKSSEIVLSIFNFIGIDITSTFGQYAHFLVRKSAHLLEYFILGILFFLFISEWLSIKYVALYTLLFSFLYACTDEFHQSFIPNRSGQFQDVVIDTFGAFIGIIFMILLLKYINKCKLKNI